MGLWHYTINNQPAGPVEETQVRRLLASGVLKPTDLVWTEGMQTWRPAGDVLTVPAIPLAVAAANGAPPIQLTYAAPTVVPLPVIGNDEGPFLKIGRSFSLGGRNRWSGVAIVSPRAFYLLKRRQLRNAYGYYGFGLVGGLLAAAFTTVDDIRTCDIVDLPHSIRLALDPKTKLKKGNVIVVPREAVRYVKVGSMFGVSVQVGGDKFTLSKGLFAGGRIRRFMQESGWILGSELMPTAAPMHGQGFGRQFHEIEKIKRSIGKRVVYGILGVVLLIIVIILRILGGH